jgi:hypothetical protein
MAIFNRILLFLIMVLAIAAAGLSYLLFQNRNAMRDRADLLAETVVDMTQTLDKQSQSGVAGEVTFDPRVPETGENDTGTLSWATFMEGKEDEFAGFKATLKKTENLADKVIKQRNAMAKSMREIGETLGFQEPDVDDLLTNVKKLDQAEGIMDGIESLASATRKRDIDMIDGYIQIAKDLDVNLRTTAFTTRSEDRDEEGNVYYGNFEHAGQISQVIETLEALNARVGAYGDALADLIRRIPTHNWSVSPFAITDKANYQRTLTSMINDFDAINAELVRSEQRKQRIEELGKQIKGLELQLTEVSKERDELIAKVAEFEKLLGEIGKPAADNADNVEDQSPTMLPKDLQGSVVYVNKEFGFIVMDLGTKQQLRRGVEFLVARNDQFVARAIVTEVRPEQAVAELSPVAMTDMAQIGDRVIPAPEFVE